MTSAPTRYGIVRTAKNHSALKFDAAMCENDGARFN